MNLNYLIKNFFKDKDGKVVIGQFPNLPLILTIISFISSFVFKNHSTQFGMVTKCFLFVWAWLELFEGVNLFRRFLGLLTIIFIIFKIFN